MIGASTSLLREKTDIRVGNDTPIPPVALSYYDEKRLPEPKDLLETANQLLFYLDYEYQSAADMDIYECSYPVDVRDSVDSAILITINANEMVTMVEDVTEKLKSDIANVRKSIANDGVGKFLFVRLKR